MGDHASGGVVGRADFSKGQPHARDNGHGGGADDGHVELDHVEEFEWRGGISEIGVEVRGQIEHDDAGYGRYDRSGMS